MPHNGWVDGVRWCIAETALLIERIIECFGIRIAILMLSPSCQWQPATHQSTCTNASNSYAQPFTNFSYWPGTLLIHTLRALWLSGG